MDGRVSENAPLILGAVSEASPGEGFTSKNHDADPTCTSEPTSGDLNKDGLSVAWAIVTILGFMLGAGALAMPLALSKAGWYGLVSIALSTMSQLFAGILLSKSWVTVRGTYPEVRHISNPYPLMGEKALGWCMGMIISIANGFYNVGLSMVLFLISGQNIQSLVAGTRAELSVCYWIIILSAVLIPLSWLKTPKNFKFVALTSIVTIVTACTVIAVLMVLQLHAVGPSEHVESPTHTSYFLSLGIVFYAYSGTGLFPTVQEDMIEKSKFTTVLLVCLLVLAAWYVLIGCLGYIAYGSDVSGNVIQSLPRGPARIAAEIFTTVHMLSAIITAMNPLFQDIESIEYLNISQDFSVKRYVMRTLLMCLLTFLCLSLPNFSGLQALVGATLSQFLSFVAPCLIYWRLSVREEPEKSRPMPLSVKVICVLVITYGVLGGIASTYSAAINLFSSQTFVAPCYVNITAASHMFNTA